MEAAEYHHNDTPYFANSDSSAVSGKYTEGQLRNIKKPAQSPKGSSHALDEANIEPLNHHFYSIFEVLEESLNYVIPSQCLDPNLVLTQHAHTIDQLFQGSDTLPFQGSNTLQDSMIVLGSCATSQPATGVAYTSYLLPELIYFHAFFGDL